MSETKEQLAERISEYNRRSALIPTGTVVASDLFGDITLDKFYRTDEDGYDVYLVHHSGYFHNWSSASVAVIFKDSRE